MAYEQCEDRKKQSTRIPNLSILTVFNLEREADRRRASSTMHYVDRLKARVGQINARMHNLLVLIYCKATRHESLWSCFDNGSLDRAKHEHSAANMHSRGVYTLRRIISCTPCILSLVDRLLSQSLPWDLASLTVYLLSIHRQENLHHGVHEGHINSWEGAVERRIVCEEWRAHRCCRGQSCSREAAASEDGGKDAVDECSQEHW